MLSSFSKLLVLVDSNLLLLDKDNFEGRPLSGLKGVSLVYEDAFDPESAMRLLVCSKKKVQVRMGGRVGVWLCLHSHQGRALDFLLV